MVQRCNPRQRTISWGTHAVINIAPPDRIIKRESLDSSTGALVEFVGQVCMVPRRSVYVCVQSDPRQRADPIMETWIRDITQPPKCGISALENACNVLTTREQRRNRPPHDLIHHVEMLIRIRTGQEHAMRGETFLPGLSDKCTLDLPHTANVWPPPVRNVVVAA